MASEPTVAGRLVELSPPECWDRMVSRPVGRLAWTGPGGPTVIPVNFTVDGHSVYVRTTAYSAAARECEDSLVAFQVDSIDDTTHTGWSVLVRGRARRAPADPAAGPHPWLRGPRSLLLRIDADEISGRLIRAGS